MKKRKILFMYRAGLHHVLHSLYIAIELSKIQSDYEVCILNTSLRNNRLIKKEINRLKANITYYDKSKLFSFVNQNYNNIIRLNKKIFKQASVILTSSFGISKLLRKHNIINKIVIFTHHGTGDRKYTFNPDVFNYDCVLIPSKKMYDQYKYFGILNKLKNYIIADYCKFDYLFYNDRPQLKLFNNNLPTILYNPHWDKNLSSLYKDGEKIVNSIIDTKQYNLILSPHPLVNSWFFLKRIKLHFPKSNLLHRDWSSIHQINFDYMKISDIYLGDVSSSAYEWLYFNKPIIFYNSHNIDWKNNPYFKFWEMGYVVNNTNDLISSIGKALNQPDPFLKIRTEIRDYTFGKIDGKASLRTAEKLYKFLKDKLE